MYVILLYIADLNNADHRLLLLASLKVYLYKYVVGL
jgi:hypothetical protein